MQKIHQSSKSEPRDTGSLQGIKHGGTGLNYSILIFDTAGGREQIAHYDEIAANC